MPKVTIAQNILAANDTIALQIQQLLTAGNVRTINVMSSPGAGKTTLLERTIERLHTELGIGVIEGDIETGSVMAGQSVGMATRLPRTLHRTLSCRRWTSGSLHVNSPVRGMSVW